MPEKTLNRELLTKKDKELLERILVKRPGDLNESEISILRARKSYLMPVELQSFKEVLEDKVEYSRMKNEELLNLLKERKIEVPETAKKKADYVALLEEDDNK